MYKSIKDKSQQRIHITDPYEDDCLNIHFIGDVLMNRNDEIAYHYNPGYEVCVITSGKGIFKIDDKAYPISSDQIFITKAPQYHGGWPSIDEPYRIQYICFSIKNNKANEEEMLWQEVNQKLATIKLPIANERFSLKEVHRRLMQEVMQQEQYTDEIIKALVKQFILLSLRNFYGHPLEDNRESQFSSSKLMAQKIIYYIDENVREELSLERISAHFKYSIPYICKCFKKETGFAVMEYYNYVRLESAKDEIKLGKESISAISEKYTYGSIQHFSNAFKEVYGMSPIEYKRQCEEK